MNESEFGFISQLLKERSGLSLTQDKGYLLESRLLPIARENGHKTLEELIALLRLKPDEKIIARVVDAMTTNESMFFRDIRPFEHLRRIILPRLREKKPDGGHVRIWSAACSSGQEPYSVAICLLEEATSMPGFTYEIVATDISPRILEKARAGIYTQFEVQRGLPIAVLLKYFSQLPDNTWQASEKLRGMVTYRPFNLLDDFVGLGEFDLILCRNVLIYFDDTTKTVVLNRLSHTLSPEGVLLLGSTETILGISDRFQVLGAEHGIYVPVG